MSAPPPPPGRPVPDQRLADLKAQRDRYRQALELVLGHGCILCRATAQHALGLPFD